VAGPIFLTWWSWNLPLLPRMSQAGSQKLDWGEVLSLRDSGAALQRYLNNNLLPPFLHIIQRVDTSYFYYGGETPLILGFMLPTFFLGIVHALWRWRIAGSLLLLWVALTLLGNSLLNERANTWSARYMVVLPVLALLMALGLRFTAPLLLTGLFQWAETRFMGLSAPLLRWAAAGLLGTGVVVMAALQIHYYFAVHLPFYNGQIRPDYDHIDAFYRTRLLPADTSIVFVAASGVPTPQLDTLGAFWDFQPRITVVTPAEFTPNYVSRLPASGLAFYVAPHSTTVPALLRMQLDGVEGALYSPFNVPQDKQYALYYVPPREP
jgi:hypothetical protein